MKTLKYVNPKEYGQGSEVVVQSNPMEKGESHYIEVTNGIYGELDRAGVSALIEYQDSIRLLKTGEAVTDEIIAQAADKQAACYEGYFSTSTEEAITYITEDIPGTVAEGPTEVKSAMGDVLAALASECNRSGLPKEARMSLEDEIAAGWDEFAKSASDYVRFAHTTFVDSTRSLVRPQSAWLQEIVAKKSEQSFAGLLKKLEKHVQNEGPLPPNEPAFRRAASWLITRGEKTPRQTHSEQSAHYIQNYTLPNPSLIIGEALKSEYLRRAKAIYGEQAIDLSRGRLSDPEVLYLPNAELGENETIIRPRTPQELAEELVDKLVIELLFADTSISREIDRYGDAFQRSARQVRKQEALALLSHEDDTGLIVLQAPPLSPRKDPFAAKTAAVRKPLYSIAEIAAVAPHDAKHFLRPLAYEEGVIMNTDDPETHIREVDPEVQEAAQKMAVLKKAAQQKKRLKSSILPPN